jgi:leader peptidase (prepilin peptidase)/N-methyltransferase
VNAALLALVFLLGLAVGSFLNVVIYRVPRGESLLHPGSHCPSCQAPIRARHNIPVLGWLLLRGRCYDCGAPISVRYPLVELGTGLLFLALALRVDIAVLPAYLYFAAAGVALALIDLDVRRLPNAIVVPSYPVVAALLFAAALWDHSLPSFVRSLLGAAALFAFFAAIAFIYPAGMGWGDVKLAGLIGLVLGYLSWLALAVGAFLGFLLGSVVGVAIIALGRAGRRTAVPFGPFMIVGALAGIFWFS